MVTCTVEKSTASSSWSSHFQILRDISGDGGGWIFEVQNHATWKERSDYDYYSIVSGISAPFVLNLSSLIHGEKRMPG